MRTYLYTFLMTKFCPKIQLIILAQLFFLIIFFLFIKILFYFRNLNSDWATVMFIYIYKLSLQVKVNPPKLDFKAKPTPQFSHYTCRPSTYPLKNSPLSFFSLSLFFFLYGQIVLLKILVEGIPMCDLSFLLSYFTLKSPSQPSHQPYISLFLSLSAS